MHDTEESRAAKRILDALERGGTPMSDAAIWIQDIDPVLVHAIVAHVRESYRAGDAAGSGVLKRLAELTAACPSLQARHAEGAQDPITEWFESAHDWSEFRGRSAEMIDLIVDKLES